MNKLKNRCAATFALAILFIAALSGSIFGQSDASKKSETGEKQNSAENAKPVDARQSGVWTVGIDPNKNAVQLSNSAANPLPVKIIESGSRKPF